VCARRGWVAAEGTLAADGAGGFASRRVPWWATRAGAHAGGVGVGKPPPRRAQRLQPWSHRGCIGGASERVFAASSKRRQGCVGGEGGGCAARGWTFVPAAASPARAPRRSRLPPGENGRETRLPPSSWRERAAGEHVPGATTSTYDDAAPCALVCSASSVCPVLATTGSPRGCTGKNNGRGSEPSTMLCMPCVMVLHGDRRELCLDG
jgi:hypothetical protein